MNELETFSNAEELAQAAADRFVSMAADAIGRKGSFSVVLSGGSTPKATYALLGSQSYRMELDWTRVHIFWGDERCVPPDHPDSNYRMAQQALLDRVNLPAGNIHRMRGELKPELAAIQYEETIRSFLRGDAVGFDLIWLGMGDDGHTASLFPGAAAVHESERWVVANYVQKLGSWRLTLTPVVLNSARVIVFLVSGSSKAVCLKEVRQGVYDPSLYPAQIVRPPNGEVVWLVDEEAASLLR